MFSNLFSFFDYTYSHVGTAVGFSIIYYLFGVFLLSALVGALGEKKQQRRWPLWLAPIWPLLLALLLILVIVTYSTDVFKFIGKYLSKFVVLAAEYFIVPVSLGVAKVAAFVGVNVFKFLLKPIALVIAAIFMGAVWTVGFLYRLVFHHILGGFQDLVIHKINPEIELGWKDKPQDVETSGVGS